MNERKLKILHVTTTVDCGGAEAMLANVVEAMGASGHRVSVATMSADGVDTGDEVAERIRDGADRFVDLEASSVLSPRAIWKLVKLIREERPDVVQTWMHHADLLGGIAARLADTGTKVVWGIHSRGIFTEDGASWVKRVLLRRVMVWAARLLPARIVSCSKAAIEDHVAMGYPARKMLWICNGIVTGRFENGGERAQALKRELGIPADAPVIGYVGRFAPVKDMATYFRAAAIVQAWRDDVHFVCCGGTLESAGDDVKAAVAALPDASRVHVLGRRGDVEAVYPLFSVCSLTSVSEAFPMVLLEAMASGVPCVSTDVGDAREIIDRTGRVVGIGQAGAIASAWLGMIGACEGERRAKAAAARERCRQEFSLERSVREYGELYQELCA